MQAGGHEAGEVRHVNPEGGADLVRDIAEGLEVEVTRVGRPAGDDDARALRQGGLTHLFGFDAHRLTIHLIGDCTIVLTREVQAHAVGEVATVGQGQAQNRVTDVRHRHQRGRVGLSSRVGLDIDVVATENLLGALDRERLGDVHKLTAAVVAATRVALRILVREDRALRLQNGARNEVLRGDHLEGAALTLQFGVQHCLDLGVQLRQRHVVEGIHRVLLLIIRL
jgi:hypothetical protein